MPRALPRSRTSRIPLARGLSSSSHRSSRPRGTPARTWRGRSTRPCVSGARGTPDGETPAQRPVSVACSSPARSTTSWCGSPGGMPCSAASTQKPMIRTDPALSSSTFSGDSRPWATPCACAAAIESATSLTSQAPRRGDSGPLLGEHDVERGAGAPLVDDEAEVVDPLGVEHPQDPLVQDRRRAAGRLEQQLGARVVGRDHVQRDVPLEDPVVRAPEPAAPALAEQVDQPVPVGEHVAGPGRVRHRAPTPSVAVADVVPEVDPIGTDESSGARLAGSAWPARR